MSAGEQSPVHPPPPQRRSNLPAYLLDRRKTGIAKNGRLSWALVREIRRWASRDGYGLSQTAQVARLQASYPISVDALRDVLVNGAWYDPMYHPGEPDRDYFNGLPLSQLVLWEMRRWERSA